MNSRSCICISAMKPCCRFLVSFKSSSLFGVSPTSSSNLINSSKLPLQCRKIESRSIRSGIHCRRRIVLDRNAFCNSDSISWGGRGGSSLLNGRGSIIGRGGRGRGVLVIPRVASDFRNQSSSSSSSSLSSHVNKDFESIFVKPLVFKELPKKESDAKFGNVGVKGEEKEEVVVVISQSEAEREAWKLLRGAVVDYCGFPVGTVAANDPGDKQTLLNYDQVFIRDFVPSAYAFLLDGEGEIVRNFLLQTLQLQVTFS